jgi:hypothetical protein
MVGVRRHGGSTGSSGDEGIRLDFRRRPTSSNRVGRSAPNNGAADTSPASVKKMVDPTEAMIDAAHATIWYDDAWAVFNRREFRPVVRAIITHAIAEGL